MTETPSTKIDAPTETEDEPTTDGSSGTTASESRTGAAGSGLDTEAEAIRRYLAWGGLAVCSLLAVYALFQFYGSVVETIELWVDPQYQPVTSAAFNLAVLLASLIGVSLLVRELS